MDKSVLITIIICTTIVLISLINRKKDNKLRGGHRPKKTDKPVPEPPRDK